jgi:hypothetical protein
MSELQIFLDESNENPPLADSVVVETEIEFLQHDGAEKLWVRGQICDYVRAVYRVRQIKVVEVVSPRARLRSLLGATADLINSSLLARSIEVLDRENPKSVAELLFHLTHEEFWTSLPSIEHAAQFLIIDFDNDLLDVAEVQRNIWLDTNQDRKLNDIYAQAYDERESFLRKWLFDDATRKILGEVPLQLSDKQAKILSDEIGRRLRLSKGASISEFPKKTLNKKIYAKAAIEYFSHNPINLTSDYIAQISSLLTPAERSRLEGLLPKTALAPLDINADIETALKWVTEEYLPLRSFQVENNQSEGADSFAAMFADWMLENYPKLTNADRETSPINLRTFYTVKSLAEKYWVLWVVVDGLSYTNHQKLLQLLGEKSASLRVEQNYPLLAVLPTITEKAKYGLTTGKFPQENERGEWGPQHIFLTSFPDGIYAGDAGAAKLTEGLNQEAPTVCYWNYISIDDCFHDESDLAFVQHEVDGQLRSLAGKINQLVVTARDPNRVAVVICSDHGQVLGRCRKSQIQLENLKAHGRTVLADIAPQADRADRSFSKNVDGETVFLNPKSFRLSEPTTVALGSTFFVDWGNKASKEAIGVHGGLFPEEVVVGMSVLVRQPIRNLLTAVISGAGETGKGGIVILEIDNPNSAAVRLLSINVEGIEIPEQGELLLMRIAPYQAANFEIAVLKFPTPQTDEEFSIQGVLRYEFDDGAQEECAVSGKLSCKSLYSAKNPRLRDRIKL